MIVRQHGQVLAEHDRVAIVVVVPPRVPAAAPLGVRDPGDLHRLGAAGQLPEQLVPAAERIGRARRGLGLQLVGELDAVDHIVLEALPPGDVELVAVAVAGAKALVALAGLVQRVEVHDQVQLVVGLVRHPREGVGVVGAGFVEDGEGFTMTRGGGARGDAGHHRRHGGGRKACFGELVHMRSFTARRVCGSGRYYAGCDQSDCAGPALSEQSESKGLPERAERVEGRDYTAACPDPRAGQRRRHSSNR